MRSFIHCFWGFALLTTTLACGVKSGPLPPLDDPIATLGSKKSASPTPTPSPSASPAPEDAVPVKQ